MRVVVRGLLPVVAVAVLLWPAGVAAALSDSGVRATLGQVSCPDPTKAGAVQVTMAVETDSSTPSPYTVTVVNGQDPAGSGTTSGMVAPDATDRPALHTVVVDAMVHIQVTSGDE